MNSSPHFKGRSSAPLLFEAAGPAETHPPCPGDCLLEVAEQGRGECPYHPFQLAGSRLRAEAMAHHSVG